MILGVGRAGLFACCWLLKNLYCLSAERAIRYIRIRRSPKAIETMRQAEFIIHYSQYVGESVDQRTALRPELMTSNYAALSAPSLLEHYPSTQQQSKYPSSDLGLVPPPSKPLLMCHTDYTLSVPTLADISYLERTMRSSRSELACPIETPSFSLSTADHHSN